MHIDEQTKNEFAKQMWQLKSICNVQFRRAVVVLSFVSHFPVRFGSTEAVHRRIDFPIFFAVIKTCTCTRWRKNYSAKLIAAQNLRDTSQHDTISSPCILAQEKVVTWHDVTGQIEFGPNTNASDWRIFPVRNQAITYIYRVAQKSKPPPIFQKIVLKIANEIRFLRKVEVWFKHYNTIRW